MKIQNSIRIKKTAVLLFYQLLLAGLFFTSTSLMAQNVIEFKLNALDATNGDNFGSAVAISGDWLVAGAVGEDQNGSNAGAAYFFHWNGTQWVQNTKATAPGGESGDNFGGAVAISGNFALIGSQYHEVDNYLQAGAAYIYKYNGSSWIYQAQLTAPAPVHLGNFGSAVAIDGNYIVVGEHLGENSSGVRSGAAYVFKKQSATNWVLEATLEASDSEYGDEFGISAAIDSNVVVIGSYLEDTQNQDAGAVYVFESSGSIWTETAQLVANDGGENDKLGFAVDVSNNTIVAGALHQNNLAGATYIFSSDGNNWSQSSKIVPPDTHDNQLFGKSVALYKHFVLIGASGDTHSGTDTGAAYLFYYQNEIWNELKKIVASDAEENSQYGFSVAIDEHYAISAYTDNEWGLNSGSVYAYRDLATTPPKIETTTLSALNDFVDIQFTEGVFGNANATLPAEIADFNLIFFTENSTFDASINAVTTIDNMPLSGGESIIRLHLDISPTPSGNETIELFPAQADCLFDNTGHAMPISETTGTITLNDMLQPSVSITSTEVSPTSNPHFPVTIEFSEPVNGFELTDIAVENGNIQNLQPTANPNEWTAEVYPQASGWVTVAIPEAVVADDAGNPNIASEPFTIEVDIITAANNFSPTPVSVHCLNKQLSVLSTDNQELIVVKLLSLQGRVLLSETISGTANFDMNHLSSGIYIILLFDATNQLLLRKQLFID